MKRTFAVLAACLLLLATSASAHRIDEYLQATLFSLQPDRVDASMRLIPGVLVAPAVIAAIDSNRDGVFSEEEERIYAQRVLDDLTLTIDRKRIEPKLVSWSFPQPPQLRNGLGEIHIEYTAKLPDGGPVRVLLLANRHQTERFGLPHQRGAPRRARHPYPGAKAQSAAVTL